MKKLNDKNMARCLAKGIHRQPGGQPPSIIISGLCLLLLVGVFGLPSHSQAQTVTITYTYDTGTNGIGRLTSVSDALGDHSTKFYYDAVGRINQTDKIVDGTTYPASTSQTLSTTWTTYSYNWTTNPRTGAAWTVADVNGTGTNPLKGFGVQSGNGDESVTQVYITVGYQ